MNRQTRAALAAFMNRQAQLHGVSDLAHTFAVEPSMQQTIEQKIMESSSFLQAINVVGVDEMQGEKLGLGSSGPLASRTDTKTKDRQTSDIATLDNQGYQLVQTNFDTHIRYATLDAWAKFPQFQAMVRNVGIEQQALDRIMIGWHGIKIEKDTNPATYPLLQDVNKGWLQHIREDADEQVLDVANEKIGANGSVYKNLDALVYDAYETNIKQRYRNGVQFVAILGEELLKDKYFPLVNNNNDKATEINAMDMIISQKRIGYLQAVQVPFFPARSILITPLNNLSIYYQNGKRRMKIEDNAKRDQIETYESSNEGYVVEKYERSVLIENIKFAGEA